jgi:hypothetical protein
LRSVVEDVNLNETYKEILKHIYSLSVGDIAI